MILKYNNSNNVTESHFTNSREKIPKLTTKMIKKAKINYIKNIIKKKYKSTSSPS